MINQYFKVKETGEIVKAININFHFNRIVIGLDKGYDFDELYLSTEEEYNKQFEKDEIEEINKTFQGSVRIEEVKNKLNEVIRVVNKINKIKWNK